MAELVLSALLDAVESPNVNPGLLVLDQGRLATIVSEDWLVDLRSLASSGGYDAATANPTDGGTDWVADVNTETWKRAGAYPGPGDGEVGLTTGGSHRVLFTDLAGPDHYVECTIGSSRQSGWGVIVRADGDDDCVVAYMTAGSGWRVGEYVGGVLTSLLALTSYTTASGAVVRLEAEGTTVRLYVNGVQVGGDLTCNAALTGVGVGIRAGSAVTSTSKWGAIEADLLTPTGGELGGGALVDLAPSVIAASGARGRNRETDDYEAGTTQLTLADTSGQWHPMNEGGAYWPNLTPRREVAVGISVDGSEAVPLFAGYVDDWRWDRVDHGLGLAEVVATDVLAWLAGSGDISLAVLSEDTGARIATVLVDPDVDYQGPTALDTGQTTCPAGTAEGQVLDYLRTVARGEQGFLYVDASGVLIFRERHTAVGSPALVFADDGTSGAIRYRDQRVTNGMEAVYTVVRVTRAGGTQQEATASAELLARYGRRLLELTNLPLGTDDEALQLAQWLAGRYGEARPRISQLVVDVDMLGTQDALDVLTLELADLVTVRTTPLDLGETVEHPYLVDSIRWRWSAEGPVHLEVALGVTPAEDRAVFRLDDDVYGRLDHNLLTY